MTAVARDGGINCDGLTFGEFVDEAQARFGDHPAIVAVNHATGEVVTTRWTYRELAAEVRALQAGLEAAGVQPGERVAVMLSSFPEWIVYFFAVTRLGAVFLPVNPRYGAHELRHVLAHSGSSTLVASGQYLGRDYRPTIAGALGDWGPQGGGESPDLRRIIGVTTSPHPAALDHATLLEAGRARAEATPVVAAAVDPTATAVLFYTSGTTAFPKGVPLSHRNLLPHNVRSGALIGMTEADRVLTLYPFFGISGGANKVLSTLGFGACLVFQDAFRAVEAFELLEREGCTVIHALDVQLRELIPLARSRGAPPPKRRGTMAFMAGVDEVLAKDVGRWLGLEHFVHPYGMSETNPMILRNSPEDPFEYRLRPGGRCAPGVEVRVVDAETGIPRPVGEVGEIEVRGESVMRGYYRDPEASAKAFREDWFRTGDNGVQTADGCIFYQGRLRDMLKVGGFNVAPQEVEAFLRTLASVEEVGVTGVADPKLGEVVVAFVRAKAGHAVDEALLREACRGQLANFKTPKYVGLVDQLPYHTAAHGAKMRRDILRTWAEERFGARQGQRPNTDEETR